MGLLGIDLGVPGDQTAPAGRSAGSRLLASFRKISLILFGTYPSIQQCGRRWRA